MAKNIDELAEYLKTCKNIQFEIGEEERAKKFLMKYSYSNVISLKWLFATGKNENNLQYDLKTKFKDVEAKYFELMELENIIREGTLLYETELKSNFIQFLNEFIKKENISFRKFINNLYEFNNNNFVLKFFIGKKKKNRKLKKIFKSEWKRHVKKYSGHKEYEKDYHILIKILNFGVVNRMLGNFYKKNILLETEFKKYLAGKDFKLGKTDKRNDYKTVGILRNAMCHKESLIIFLDKGMRTNKSILKERKEGINFIYKYWKNSTGNEEQLLDPLGAILKFENYYLQNKKNRTFNKIKF